MTQPIETVRTLINKIAVRLFQFTNYTLIIERFYNKSVNYTANLFAATLTTANNNKNEFICKVAALEVDVRSEFPAKIYDIEINFYKNLVPHYKQLQDEYEVFGKDRLSTVNFYGCVEHFLQETLMFDNVFKQGFKSFDRFQCIDWEYAAVAVTELAKLHALSFSYNFKQPKEYKEHLKVFRFHLEINQNIARKIFWGSVVNAAVEVTRVENKEKLRNYLHKNLFRGMNNFFAALRAPVLGHGDFRPSNMLHRKTEEDGLEIMIVNYQTMRQMSPVVDLIHLLVTSTDAQFRRDYCEQLQNYYYEQLSTSMRRLHVDPENTYPREHFDYEWKQKLPYSLCVAAFFLPLITMEDHKLPKSYKEIMNCHASNKTELFTTRMNEIVDDFNRWGFLI